MTSVNRSPQRALASREVFALFERYRDLSFLLVEPGGNHGDYLIYRGAEILAQEAGIRFRSLSHKEFMASPPEKNTVVYIHGSGGYCPWWTQTPVLELRKAVSEFTGPVILGPTTFHADRDFFQETIAADLKTPREDIHVIAREKTSYAAIEEVLPKGVNLLLDHDTALNCTAEDLFPGPRRKRPAPYAIARYSLYAIRQDKEAFGEVEQNPLAVRIDAGEQCYDFLHWAGVHRWAREIVTNRLHSSILGAIFGIPTTLLPNRYHKNRSVWEFSLRERGVQWAENVPLTGWAKAIKRNAWLDSMVEASLVQRILKGVVYGARHRNLVR